MSLLKKRRLNWLKRVLSKTVEDRQKSRGKKLMTCMSRIDKKYLRTFRGTVWVQRNEPCPCGNTYGDDSPVKFKDCCWRKHAVTEEVTPVQLAEQKKVAAYVAKKGKLPR